LSNDTVDVFLLALLAACYPTLVAAVAVMLLLPNPKRLLFGYLLGAYTTSITLGLVIVFSLQGSDAVGTSKRTISPAQDIAVGVILLIVASVLASGRDESVRRRRQERKEARQGAGDAQAPWSQRMLGRGSARITYAVGVLLSFPGVTYLVALDRIADLGTGVPPTVLLVVSFCLIQLVLLELPLLGYIFAPKRTQEAVTRFRAWLGRSGRRIGIIGVGTLGVLLLARGLIELL
jgi:hypothetical protein